MPDWLGKRSASIIWEQRKAGQAELHKTMGSLSANQAKNLNFILQRIESHVDSLASNDVMKMMPSEDQCIAAGGRRINRPLP